MSDIDTRIRQLDRQLHAAVKAHALAEYPNEAVGIITTEGLYQQLQNVAADPRHTFDCHEQIVPLIADGQVLALVHSHPDGPMWPSAYDMQQQIAMDIPFGLIANDHEGSLPLFFWGDMLEPPPLLNRGFRYGPAGTDGRGDCAALVRDYYRLERGILLKEFPRENRWWLAKGVSYAQNMLSAGFKHFDGHDPQVGDVFLTRVRSTAPDHAGIYIGNGRILHHLENRFSREDSAISWVRQSIWFRYEAPEAT